MSGRKQSAIVVGVDGSETSLRAAAYAMGSARRRGTRLVVVYARVPAGGLAGFMDSTGASRALAMREQDRIEQMLRQARTEAADEGVEIELLVRQGDPYQVLSEVADELRADCVVVGSSECLGHRVAGSIAVWLVRGARWPVTVVP
jgi:nucleotide-binding universal stress UspA family protein